MVAKGKKLTDRPLRGINAAERAELVVGPSGKLRAPTILVGDAIVVGFHEDAYRDVIG